MLHETYITIAWTSADNILGPSWIKSLQTTGKKFKEMLVHYEIWTMLDIKIGAWGSNYTMID